MTASAPRATPSEKRLPDMSYRPPKHVLELLQKIEYEEALPDGDPRYVDTEAARGSEKTFSRLASKFGWAPVSNAFFAPAARHGQFTAA